MIRQFTIWNNSPSVPVEWHKGAGSGTTRRQFSGLSQITFGGNQAQKSPQGKGKTKGEPEAGRSLSRCNQIG